MSAYWKLLRVAIIVIVAGAFYIFGCWYLDKKAGEDK